MWIKVTFLLVYFPSLNIVFIEENTGFNTPGIKKWIMANILVYLLVYFIFICIFLIILKVGGL